MRILIGSDRLDELSGGVTYVLTVAEQLQRLGHEVWLHAPGAPGEGAEARRRGLRVAADPADLAEPPELVYAQDTASAYATAAAWPSVPQVFCVHSDDWDLSLPPQVQGVAAAVVALHGRVETRARAAAVVPEVVRLTQPIDVTRFRPVSPLADPPSRVLLISNYVTGDRLALVEEACAAAGFSLRCIGLPFGTATTTDHHVYGQGDIVLGKARVALEAMACGRAMYVYDLNGGGGWVTPESYARLEADNFGGQGEATAMTVETLARDLGAVRSDMGPANRDLVIAGHQATKHAEALVALFARVASETVGPGRGPWLELARMARLQWDTDRLVGAGAEREALRAELTRVHAEYRNVYAELERVREVATERETG
jgi:hypothetical protein